MSNLLQLACPNCSARLQVKRPASATASARCGNCGHTFKFRVPQQPAYNPSTANPPPGDDFLGGLPERNTTIGSQPRSPAGPARPARPARTPSRRAATGKNRWPARIAILGSSLVLLIGVIGAAAWLLLGKSDWIPASLSVFDSAGAILEEADAQDLEIQRIVNEITGDDVGEETITELVKVDGELRLLAARAAKLTPMSEAEVIELTGVENGTDEETPPGRIFQMKKPVPEGPIDDDAMEALREKVLDIPKDKRSGLTFVLSRALGKSEFIREYIRYGHLELPEPNLRGEQIAVRQIELLRQANILGASVVPKIRPKEMEDFETSEEIQRYVRGKFEPVFDDLSDLAEQLHTLAAERYQLPGDQVGDTEKYEDIYSYTNKMLVQVYQSVIGLDHGKIKTFDSLSELLAANKDLQRAPFTTPSRLAVAPVTDPKAEADRVRREYEQQRQAAAEKRALEKELEAERKRAEAAEAKLAAATTAEREAAERRAAEKKATAEMPAEDSVASNAAPQGPSPNQGSGSNRDPAEFGPGRFGPGGRPGSRFGPDRPNRFGGPRGFSGPTGRGGRPGGMDGRGGPQDASRQPGARKPPSFDPSTGVTILIDSVR